MATTGTAAQITPRETRMRLRGLLLDSLASALGAPREVSALLAASRAALARTATIPTPISGSGDGSGSPSSPITSITTTVMLSSPPPALAAVISARAAASVSASRRMMALISVSRTIPLNPSEQISTRSPSVSSSEMSSTSMSRSMPRARVITDRCGCIAACSRVICPERTSSSTRLWSSVTRASIPARST